MVKPEKKSPYPVQGKERGREGNRKHCWGSPPVQGRGRGAKRWTGIARDAGFQLRGNEIRVKKHKDKVRRGLGGNPVKEKREIIGSSAS